MANPKLLFSYPFKPYLPSSRSHSAEQILVLYVSIGILYYMRSRVDASLTVNLGVLELSSRNLVIEKHVDLAKGAILGLGKAEPAPDVAQKVSACVE